MTSNDREQRVHEIFDEVVDMPPEQREASLADRCAGDTELMAAVQSLLQSDEATDAFLEPPVASALAGLMAQEVAADLVGTLVGPYRIKRLIASGGMGTVYQAARVDGAPGQDVAVKVIREGLRGPDMLRRFDRERKLLASLGHANVASLVDAGVTPDGFPYLVMEYIDGEAIDTYCDGRTLTVRQRLHLMLDVCAAVTYAHRNLLVHRDIKPSNILVTRAGVPKLLDFGIAKLIPDHDDTAAWTRTATERRIVTPQYASPEVLRGEPVSTTMDVYSLGLVLFELLTGRRPYNVTDRSAGSAERLICELEPPAPSAVVLRPDERVSSTGTRTLVNPDELARRRGASPHDLRRMLRGDLDTVVMTALHKDVGRRYQSVEQLASDVERYLTGFPILARKDSFSYRIAKFYDRHRLGVIMSGVAMLCLFVGVAGVVYGYVHARRETRVAQLEAAKASQINAFLHEMLAAADPEDGRTDMSVREVLDAASLRLEQDSFSMPEVRAAVHQTVGETYLNLGLHAEAEPHLREAVRLRLALEPERPRDSCASLLALGRALRLRGSHEEAEITLQDALSRSRRLGTEDLPLVVQSLIALARVKEDQGAFGTAESLLREAIEQGRGVYGPVHRDVAEAMERLGMVLSGTGKQDEATQLCRQALAINQSLFGSKHVRVSNSLRRLAVVLQEQSRFEEAEPLYRESLAMHRALFGNEHPEVARVLNNLGWLLFVTGRQEEGREMLRESLSLRRRIFGDKHISVATTLNNLAATLEPAPAEPLLRESLALSEEIYGRRHFSVGRTSQNLATCLKDQGKLTEAGPLYRRAVDIMTDTLGPDHPSVAYAYFGLADVLARRGAADEAEPLLRTCIGIPSGGRPANDALRVSALGLLGEIETQREDYTAAEAHLLEACRMAESFVGPERTEAVTTQRRKLVELYERWGRPQRAEVYRADTKADSAVDEASPD